MNRLTLEDEIYLDELKSRLEKFGRKTDALIVIHNLTHVRTAEQLDTVIRVRVLSISKGGD